jgi:hypothetical protein
MEQKSRAEQAPHAKERFNQHFAPELADQADFL